MSLVQDLCDEHGPGVIKVMPYVPRPALGDHIVVYLPNGYGASIIPDHGLREVGVMAFTGPAGTNRWSLAPGTPVAPDSVIRHLSDDEVIEVTRKIANLPARR